MSSLTVQIPDSLFFSLKALAEREGCSMEDFVAKAAAEKMESLASIKVLRNGLAGARRTDFTQFLAAVPHHEVTETDRLP